MQPRSPISPTPLAALALASLACLLLALPAAAAKLGAMGDSLSDEYAEEAYGSYAQNWVEQLVIHAGLDAGPTASEASQPGGTWGEPRRTRYQYNWARAGADTATLLSGGQHTGLAALVGPEGIDYAVLGIGANNFFPLGQAYTNIYNGVWDQATIDAYVSQALADIDAALDEVLATGVRLVIVNAPDYGVTPSVRSLYPDAVKRQRVADAISQLNAGIDATAQTRQLVVVEMFDAALAIFGPHASPKTTLLIGNVAIQLGQSDTSGGGNPTAAFVHDGVHPNTTLQGVFANVIMAAMNIAYRGNHTLFTEAEILAHRGISYGGSDTLVSELGDKDYPDFVTNYAPPLPLSMPTLPTSGLVALSVLLLATALLALRRPGAETA
jgi:phospholipase/lecithinase/hemolysin